MGNFDWNERRALPVQWVMPFVSFPDRLPWPHHGGANEPDAPPDQTGTTRLSQTESLQVSSSRAIINTSHHIDSF